MMYQAREWNLGGGVEVTVTVPTPLKLTRDQVARLRRYVDVVEQEAAICWEDAPTADAVAFDGSTTSAERQHALEVAQSIADHETGAGVTHRRVDSRESFLVAATLLHAMRTIRLMEADAERDGAQIEELRGKLSGNSASFPVPPSADASKPDRATDDNDSGIPRANGRTRTGTVLPTGT